MLHSSESFPSVFSSKNFHSVVRRHSNCGYVFEGLENSHNFPLFVQRICVDYIVVVESGDLSRKFMLSEHAVNC